MDPVLFSIFVAGICLLLLLGFYWQNNKLRHRHHVQISILEQQQLDQLDQIRLRDQRLQQYRFLEYNLKDVLIVQSGIKL